MNNCSSCHQPYVPQSEAWGLRCGLCIAGEIEMMLLGELPRQRLPVHRAPSERFAQHIVGTTPWPKAVGD